MPTLPQHGGHRGVLAAVTTAALLVSGIGAVYAAIHRDAGPPQPHAAAAPVASPSPSAQPLATSPGDAQGASTGQPAPDFGPIMGPSDPVSVRIPAIGVDARDLVDLHLDTHGQLEAPAQFDRAGWYADGPTPGEFGPAVIAAHVDSKVGPAVFYRLGALAAGARVSITRADRSVATFVIDRVKRYSKADFPTSAVYGSPGIPRAEIRLITCGGAFDRATGHYVDNIVAFGHLVSAAN